MAEAEKGTVWRDLYRQAVLEPNPEKLAIRIDKAHKAIQWRICKLWHVGAADTNEAKPTGCGLAFLGVASGDCGDKAATQEFAVLFL
jgi:hypothetical protein